MTQGLRLRRWARILYWGACLAMLALAGMAVQVAFWTPLTVQTFQQNFGAFRVSDQITQAQMIAVLGAGLVPILVWIWVLDQMRRLFGAYRRGAVLTPGAARLIQRIGAGFLAIALIEVLLVPFYSVLLSWNNPQGERTLSIGLNQDMAGLLLCAGLMFVIGWAMREASRVAAENEAFV